MSIPGKLNTWLAIIGSLILIVGVLFGVDARFQKAALAEKVTEELREEIRLHGARLEGKIIRDDIRDARRTIWEIKDRHEGRSMPQDAKERIRELEVLIADLQRQMDAVRNR